MKKLVLTCGIRRECRAQWTMKGLIILKSKNSFLWKVFRQRLDLTQHPWWSGLHFTASQLCGELHLPIQCHSGGFNCQSIYRQSKMRSHAQFKASHVRQWSGWTESNWQQNEVREKADEWQAGGVTGRGRGGGVHIISNHSHKDSNCLVTATVTGQWSDGVTLYSAVNAACLCYTLN